MTKFKGTKGEWFLSETQNLRPTHVAIKNNKNSRLICLISEPKNMDIEDEANAKLIANAPKILIGLEDAISLLMQTTEFEVLEKYKIKVAELKKVLEETIT